VPVGGEPGGPTLVSALADAGHEVLLPVVPRERGPLEWARFDGSFARGPLGLREPTGERLGVEAIGTAALVLVPGLAVDRRGIRLGRGAGYYDRSLPFARAPLVMLLNDDELVERLPAEPHDHPVTAALLPKAGLVTLRGKTG
jgi:5-formyltetrahydrofolate cyclo-ligase